MEQKTWQVYCCGKSHVLRCSILLAVALMLQSVLSVPWKTAKVKLVKWTLIWKGEHSLSIPVCCDDLPVGQNMMVKEILVFWSIRYRCLDGDSIQLMSWMLDGGWMLNKLWRRMAKMCQDAVLTVSVSIFISSFFLFLPWPTPSLLCLALAVLELGEATHWELLCTNCLEVRY